MLPDSEFGGMFTMPEWWLELALPGVIFGLLFILWILLPIRVGEEDLASRIRGYFSKTMAWTLVLVGGLVILGLSVFIWVFLF